MDLFCICREEELIGMRGAIRKHAVGWYNGSSLLCRPKSNHKAVMFFKDGHHFWFHLTNKEFGAIFND